MACLVLDSSQFHLHSPPYNCPLNLQLEDNTLAKSVRAPVSHTSCPSTKPIVPKPPLLPDVSYGRTKFSKQINSSSLVHIERKHVCEILFDERYEADVRVVTDDKGVIFAHSCILGVTSPVLRNMLNVAKVERKFRCIRLPGVPLDAARAFIRFLYTSCYELDEMTKFGLHLLVLSHAFSVPVLKTVCVNQLQAILTAENVIDVLQLAKQCDAPRLSLFCIRLVIKDFKTISVSEGWKVMKQANPSLEQELLETLVEADSRRQNHLKKKEERNVYTQLHEAMEALLHIYIDGCRTIGPHDQILKGSQATCNFPACKGLESLVRHFRSCKIRVPGGCVHCKRMWQLLELHSCMCTKPDSCNVPLCRHFKDKMRNKTKKENMKWKQLVRKVMEAKGTLSSISAWRSCVG